MNIDIKDLITLSDDLEYVVASKAIYMDETYYFLVEKNLKGVKFCKEKKGTDILIEEDAEKIDNELLSLFLVNSKKSMNENELKKIDQFMVKLKNERI